MQISMVAFQIQTTAITTQNNSKATITSSSSRHNEDNGTNYSEDEQPDNNNLYKQHKIIYDITRVNNAFVNVESTRKTNDLVQPHRCALNVA